VDFPWTLIFGSFLPELQPFVMPQLEITATGANCKKLDMEAYGVTDRAGRLVLECGEQRFETKAVVGANGLDPFWEETFIFEVSSNGSD
jgi:hypothetical protein